MQLVEKEKRSCAQCSWQLIVKRKAAPLYSFVNTKRDMSNAADGKGEKKLCPMQLAADYQEKSIQFC